MENTIYFDPPNNLKPVLEGLKSQQKEAVTKAIAYLADPNPEKPYFLIQGSAGVGKAQPHDEPILTPTGWKKIGDIKIGDMVIDPITGHAVDVAQIFEHKNIKMYKVFFEDGTYAKCCEDHLWEVQSVADRKYIGRTGIERSSILSVSELLKNGIKTKDRENKFSIPLTSAVHFEKQTISLDPYLLGFMIGDGYLPKNSSAQVAITVDNRECDELYNRLNSKLPIEVTLTKRKKYKGTHSRKFGINCKIKPYLNVLGLLNKKSRQKFIPKSYLYNSVEVRKNLLAGLVDSDGTVSVYENKKKASFSTMSVLLRDNFIELIRSLGGTAHCIEDKRVKYNGGICYTIAFRVPFNPFIRKRKKKAFDSFPYLFKFRKRITSLEFLKVSNGRCLGINSKRNLYITRDYIVTHNSYSIKRALLHLPKHKIIAAATSHFAKNILENFLGKGFRVVTIAKLLGKVLVASNSKDKELRKRHDLIVRPIERYDVIIIDEISMVEDSISKEILKYGKNKKIIVLGDYFQLLPVKQEKENLFFKDIAVELTETIRFTGPIRDMTINVREELRKVRDGFVPNINIITHITNRVSKVDETGSGYIFLNNLNYFLITYIKRFKQGDRHKSARILAYRNSTIDFFNKNIRYRLFGKNPAQFEKGEIVISNGGFTITQPGGKSASIRNGEIFEVVGITPMQGPFGIDCIAIELKEKPFMKGILVVANSGKREYEIKKRKKKTAALENSFLWREYHAFVDSFAYFNFGYSSTVHKAQGSSITNIFIVEEDLMNIKPIGYKEKFHVLYTALTRASFRVYIYNKNEKADQSKLNMEYLKITSHEKDKI